MAQANQSNAAGDKRLQVAHPLLKRVLYGAAAYSLQYLLMAPELAYRNFRYRLFPPETYPTKIKTYKERPSLPVRIFFPKSYDPKSPRPLPLLFSVHGGGFVIGDPSDNDLWNCKFSETHQALVIALNYAKAPGSPYPGQRLDLEALIAAVFEDPELEPHIDAAKVGMMGFSAGGNLTLTVSEAPAVREKMTAGIVPIYPVTDLSVGRGLKPETRRYKSKLGGARGSPSDMLKTVAPIFDWSYIPVGQNLRDPLLSPYFAERHALPRRMWIVGCELDMLGHEAWRAACKYAGRAIPGMDERIGQEEPAEGGKPGTLITEGDERFAWEETNDNGEVKWLLIPDAGHGFDMAGAMRADETTVRDGELKRDTLIRLTGEWLYGQ